MNALQWLAVWVGSMAMVLSSSSVHGGLIRHDRPREAYVERGRQVEFASVGKLVINDKVSGKSKASGTGVLIAPRWVLTAAHVARQGELGDHRWVFGGEGYEAVQRILHPSYRPDRDAEVAANGWDLALVELRRPVENVRPARRYSGFDEVGRIATMVVEGRRGNGVDGPDSPVVFERLAGENVIDAAGAKIGVLEVTDRVLLWDFDHPEDASLSRLGDARPLEGEIGGAGGDSGGGMFIEKDGKWFLAGILHGRIPWSGDVDEFNSPHAKTYGQINAHVRVSTAGRWIDDVVRASKPVAVDPVD